MESRWQEAWNLCRSLQFVLVAERQVDGDVAKENVWWPCFIFDTCQQFTARIETLHAWIPSIDVFQCRLEATKVFLSHRETYDRPVAYLLGEQGKLPLLTMTTRSFFLNESTPRKDFMQAFFEVVALYEAFPETLKDAFHVAIRQVYPIIDCMNQNAAAISSLSSNDPLPSCAEAEPPALDAKPSEVETTNKREEDSMNDAIQDTNHSSPMPTVNGDLVKDQSNVNDEIQASVEKELEIHDSMSTPTTKDTDGVENENDVQPNYRRVTRSAKKLSVSKQENTLKRKVTKQMTSKTNQNKKSKTSAAKKKKPTTSDSNRPLSDENDTVVTSTSSELLTSHPACIFGSLPANWSNQFASLVSEQLSNPLLPDFQGTDAEKLDACLNSLALGNRSNGPIIVPGSSFDSNIRRVNEFLIASFHSLCENGGEKGEPAALYINGIPGNGKTSGVTWCCEKALESWSCNSPTLKVVHVNAGYLAADRDSKQRILNEMGRQLGMNSEKTKEAAVLKKITRKQDEAGTYMLLVVVDEVDMLVSSNNSSNTRLESCLTFLSKLASDPEKQLALIGISNSMNDSKLERIHELVNFKETVTFSSYSELELKSILEARVGRSVVASDVLTYVTKKVAETKGDARQAIEMLKNAVIHCRQQLRNVHTTSQSGHLVTMMHVVVANKEPADLKMRLGGLSSFGKTMFCILVSLARGGRLQTTVGVLRDLVSECLSSTSSLDEVVTWDDYLVILETLHDTGLLRLSTGNADDNGQINLAGLELAVAAKIPLRLGIQLEDVERAMVTELKEPFYQTLRDNAKEILC